LDGRRNRVYVGRFEFAAFASYEEARYAFTRLWREVEKRSDMELHTRRLVPMAFVADVPLSIGYYGALGFGVENTFTPPEADAPVWAWLESGDARLMVSKASDPVIPEAQAVLFYLYTDDVASAREELAARGFEPGPISTPFYAPGGEFRLTDPDGYVLMVTHV
jgi:hypothetical protein